jgi:putative membrane protein
MDPVLRAALSSWDLRVEVIVVLALAGTIFTLGWRRLRRRTLPRGRQSRWQASARWRPVSYLSGLFILGLALMSPVDVLGSQLFAMHMVQHLLLVMIVPPLLLLANPLPFFLWGLPASLRLKVGSWLRPTATFRHVLQKTTGPGIVWMFFVIVYWGWHDPSAYVLALQHPVVHDLEHITFFVASLLFWWHVIGAGPRIHRRFAPYARVAYALSAIPPNMFAGIAIAFAAQPLYPYYEAMPRLWGLSVMNDQRLAGVIMWVPGSMMYIIAALILVAGWLRQEEDKPALPESSWATDDALVAPGWEK